MAPVRAIFRRVSRGTDLLERLFLTLLVLGMVALAVVQIVLRNFFKMGLNEVEPFLGLMLLWLTMLGALAATGQGRHISIDLLSALCPLSWRNVLGRLVSLFAAGVCVLLAWAAGRYIGFQQDVVVRPIMGVPEWKYYFIIPVTFWLMAFRFVLRMLLPASWFVPDVESTPSGEERPHL